MDSCPLVFHPMCLDDTFESTILTFDRPFVTFHQDPTVEINKLNRVNLETICALKTNSNWIHTARVLALSRDQLKAIYNVITICIQERQEGYTTGATWTSTQACSPTMIDTYEANLPPPPPPPPSICKAKTVVIVEI